MNFFANERYRSVLEENNINDASTLMNLEGRAVKNVAPDRGTFYVELPLTSGEVLKCYSKRCRPHSLRERLKCLVYMKHLPDAVDEWNALCAFKKLNILCPNVIAAGKLSDGRSCVLSESLPECVRASEFVKSGLFSSDGLLRTRLVRKIAGITGTMHGADMAHQDLYLVHFFINVNNYDEVYIIDLQRVIFQRRLSDRWRVKDLAQLLFSAKAYFSWREIFRFWLIYVKLSKFDCVSELERKRFWKMVIDKSEKISKHDKKREKKK